MALEIQMHTTNVVITPAQQERIDRQFESIERRLSDAPDPVARLTLKSQDEQRVVTADLRITLGTKAMELISHQSAEKPDHAVRLALEDAERQLERLRSQQRGEPAYGVPSRRLPKHLRPQGFSEGTGSEADDLSGQIEEEDEIEDRENGR
ncbi:MAG: HPF/RaiA family ribosome-associated protein [Thermomicrobiales bacterium]|nr:HPF/RaiA family ribosome-associated protein [Thermomicrobiales bacterium]